MIEEQKHVNGENMSDLKTMNFQMAGDKQFNT
jgi:hypothetical protein